MSEKSTPKETLSINCHFCVQTDSEKHVMEFIADLTELLNEWREKIHVTTSTVATHDHRKFWDVFPSEAKQWENNGELIPVRKGKEAEEEDQK